MKMEDGIGKEEIKMIIIQLTAFYPDYERFVTRSGIDNIVDSWEKIFKKLNWNYKEITQDFKQAVFDLITTSKSSPAISEILNKMTELRKQRTLEELKKVSDTDENNK